MNCQFSFGPNRSYFCSAGAVYSWSQRSLPPTLARLIEDSAHPQALDIPYDVSFPMEPGAYALCWKTKMGEDWYEDGCLGPSYIRLARFIKNVATKPGAHTTLTVFGANASFFSMSPAGCCWQNLPPALEDDIHACMKIRRPTTVALGVQGSYVVLYNDGTIVFDLRGQYRMVETMIRNTQEAARRRGVMYIALNPFVAGEFYAVYGDGSASWNFPTAWSADVTAVSRHIKAMPVPAPAPAPTKPQPALPSTHASMPAVSSGGTGPAASGYASPVQTQAQFEPLAPMPTGGSFASVSNSSFAPVSGGTPAGHASPVQTPGHFAPLASMPTGGSFSSVSGFPSTGQAYAPIAPTATGGSNSFPSASAGQASSAHAHTTGGSTSSFSSFSSAAHTPPVHAPVPSTATGGGFPSFSSQTHPPAQSGAAPPTAATGGTTSAYPSFSSGSTHAAPPSGHASPVAATGGTTSSYPSFSSGSTRTPHHNPVTPPLLRAGPPQVTRASPQARRTPHHNPATLPLSLLLVGPPQVTQASAQGRHRPHHNPVPPTAPSRPLLRAGASRARTSPPQHTRLPPPLPLRPRLQPRAGASRAFRHTPQHNPHHRRRWVVAPRASRLRAAAARASRRS
ncbi:hypothetical protein DFH08DRAFT_124220 [Mycena albidolilacea]|uniref:Uncharacterized protein n=1 Tax=Mycena albidolilacea TaxID=1033008 RepID=A0AAD7A522_9AGAR|nr:hypothetical protein DFH08DRAFT_124220 [Mycena albidolilacea]